MVVYMPRSCWTRLPESCCGRPRCAAAAAAMAPAGGGQPMSGGVQTTGLGVAGRLLTLWWCPISLSGRRGAQKGPLEDNNIEGLKVRAAWGLWQPGSTYERCANIAAVLGFGGTVFAACESSASPPFLPTKTPKRGP